MVQWAAIEADFAAHYGVDVMAEIGRRTWRWFSVRLRGLPETSAFVRAVRVDLEKPTEVRGVDTDRAMRLIAGG